MLCLSAAQVLAGTGLDGETTATRAVMELLKDKNWLVRYDAVEALGKMGPKARFGRAAIKDLLHDEDESIRRAATEVLKQIDKEGK